VAEEGQDALRQGAAAQAAAHYRVAAQLQHHGLRG